MKIIRDIRGICSIICTALLLLAAITASGGAQENHVGQTAGVDNSKMGAYRALAQLTYQEFQKGNYALAAEHARILERTWDQGEGSGNPSSQSLWKRNEDAYGQADEAMDEFIKPIMDYSVKTPGMMPHSFFASVEAAYKHFQEKLNLADYGSVTAPTLPQAIHLSTQVLATYVGNYQPTLPPGESEQKPVEITADQDGLWIDLGRAGKHLLLPLSDKEFFSQEEPNIRFSFIKDAHGQITGVTAVGAPFQKATKLP